MIVHIIGDEVAEAIEFANRAIDALIPHHRDHRIIVQVGTLSGDFTGPIMSITQTKITIGAGDDESGVNVERSQVISFQSDFQRIGRRLYPAA